VTALLLLIEALDRLARRNAGAIADGMLIACGIRLVQLIGGW
jgi:hypothetical protein